MFSALPKLADKDFVIGFLLPTLLAAFAFLYLFNDVEPFKSAYHAALGIKSFGDLATAALLIWTASTIFLITNNLQYRMLEGYWGPFNRQALIKRFRVKMRARRLAVVRLAIQAQKSNATILQKQRYVEALRELLQRYPNKQELVLPTRFGNVIRAFEAYPNDVYKVETISLWLRLQAVIPKEYTALINDARAYVDFFVNVWYLAVTVTLLATIRLAVSMTLHVSPQPGDMEAFSKYLIIAACACTSAPIAYYAAVATAEAWGDLIKSAFDLYLPALAKQLGYKLPATAKDRGRFWGQLSNMCLYRQVLLPEQWTPAGSEIAENARGNKEDAPEREA